MDVELVRWPEDDVRRQALAAAGTPHLLLVEEGAEPPVLCDCLEDWSRVGVPEDDLRARLAGLGARQQAHASRRPVLDADGVLRFGEGLVALSTLEARLASALVARLGAVVGRESLSRAGWPNGVPRRNSLDVYMLRLRRRVAPLGLAIRTVRSRGYLLERRAHE